MNAKKNNATATNDLPNPGTNESIANWVNDGPYSTPGKYSTIIAPSGPTTL